MVKFTPLPVVLLLAISASTAKAEEKIRIANEGALGEAWTLQSGNQRDVLQYPAEYADNPADACMAIGYLIGADGKTSDLGLLKSWSSKAPKRDRDRYWGALAEVASNTVSQWHFVPKAGVARTLPVYTVATFVFDSPKADEARKRCAIPNLSQWVFELRTNARTSSRVSSNSIFERLNSHSGTNQATKAATAHAPPPPQPPPPPPPPPKT